MGDFRAVNSTLYPVLQRRVNMPICPRGARRSVRGDRVYRIARAFLSLRCIPAPLSLSLFVSLSFTCFSSSLLFWPPTSGNLSGRAPRAIAVGSFPLAYFKWQHLLGIFSGLCLSCFCMHRAEFHSCRLFVVLRKQPTSLWPPSTVHVLARCDCAWWGLQCILFSLACIGALGPPYNIARVKSLPPPSFPLLLFVIRLLLLTLQSV